MSKQRYRLYDSEPTECGECGESFHFDLAREFHYLREHSQ